MLLPLGPPLPDDTVSAVRGESGMLGGLSVPLKWGVAVPPDDYDHWAPKPDVSTDAGAVTDGQPTAPGADANQQDESNAKPRSGGVIPHSPAAG